MVATLGTAGALESNNSAISYATETNWGVAPAVAFQTIRFNSSTLAANRTTQRPQEISGTREAAQSVTTQVTAAGTINFSMSSVTHDEIVWADVLQNDWGATQTINGSGGDVTLTNSSGLVTLSSTTGSKFSGINVKQWIRILGFTNAANNGWWFVEAKASDTSMTLIGPNSATAVTETPSGSAAKIRASSIKNGKVCKTYFTEVQYDTGTFFQYPGSYAARATLTGGLGAFTTGTVDLVSRGETIATSTASTGAYLAAPTGRVIDPVGGFVGGFFNGAVLGSGIESFGITLENAGAASEFAMGSANAVGILGGTFTASGTMRVYFKDTTLYQNVVNETSGELAFIVKDSSGYSYAFTFLDAKLNGRIAINGPGQALSVDYTIEAGPTTNGTFVIDRMAAS